MPHLADAPSVFVVKPAVSQPMPLIDTTVLSPEDRAHFKEKGYIILRGALPPFLVRDALRVINHKLGQPDCWKTDSNPLNAAQLKLGLPREGVGTDIVNRSPVIWSAFNVLLGEGNIAPWQGGQQVALRFHQRPDVGHDVPDIKPGTKYHIDGMGQNRLCPFSMLVGIALSDQTKPNCGNLHVFPGSHLNKDLHKYYRDLIKDDNQNEEDARKPDL